MEPEYKQRTVILAWKWFIKLQISDVIVCKHPRDQRLIMKRIAKIEKDKYYALGDNLKQSTDSRIFGWIERKDIIAKVIMKL